MRASWFLLSLFTSIAAHAQVGHDVTIVNSGSTNTPGFTVVVHPGGRTTWSRAAGRGVAGASAATHGSGAVAPALAAKLSQAIAAAGSLSSAQFAACAKSISFGTRTSVDVAGDRTSDVSCVQSDPKLEAVRLAVRDVLADSGTMAHVP